MNSLKLMCFHWLCWDNHKYSLLML